MPNSANHQSIAEIDVRLAVLKEEQKQLLSFREQLQESSAIEPGSNSYSPEQKVAIFRSLFRGQTDVFANRWQNKKGRSGYSVACDNEWVQGICHKPRVKCQDCNHRQFTEINDQIIYRHLAGQQVVGVYPLMHDNTCCFLAADFDKGEWKDKMIAMSKACQSFEIPHAIEFLVQATVCTFGFSSMRKFLPRKQGSWGLAYSIKQWKFTRIYHLILTIVFSQIRILCLKADLVI